VLGRGSQLSEGARFVAHAVCRAGGDVAVHRIERDVWCGVLAACDLRPSTLRHRSFSHSVSVAPDRDCVRPCGRQ
jgi:hypothetical protein